MHSRAAREIYDCISIYRKSNMSTPYCAYVEAHDPSYVDSEDFIKCNYDSLYFHAHISRAPSQFKRAFREFGYESIGRKMIIEAYFGTKYEGGFKEYVNSFNEDLAALIQDLAPYVISVVGLKFKDGFYKPDKKFNEIFNVTHGNKIIGEITHYSIMVYASIKKETEKQHTLLEFEEEELDGLTEEQIENSIRRRLVDTRNSRLIGIRKSEDQEELIEASAITEGEPFKSNFDDNVKTVAKFIKESYDARREENRSEVA